MNIISFSWVSLGRQSHREIAAVELPRALQGEVPKRWQSLLGCYGWPQTWEPSPVPAALWVVSTSYGSGGTWHKRGGLFALHDWVVSLQVAGSASAVVRVAGAAPPVLPCWDSSSPAHEKNGKSHISNRKTVQGCFVVLHTWVSLWFLETGQHWFPVRSVLSCSWVRSGLSSPLWRYHRPPAFSLPEAFQLSTGLAE